MKRLYILATLTGLVAFSAAAQEEPAIIKMKIEAEKVAAVAAQTRIVGVRSALIGQTVKNAPYSATELSESTQVLADGTRIHNETRTTVYRDSEGRLRRETPTEVTIWDPMANASYVLNPQKMTARKITVGTFTFSNRVGELGGTVATAGVPAMAADQLKLEAARKSAELEAALRKSVAEARASDVLVTVPEKAEVFEYHVTTGPNREPARATSFSITAGGRGTAGGGLMLRRSGTPPVTDALGKQVIEGVSADGTRITSTIETGEIGNDRPLKIVSERWYSAELQTLILSRQTDPRSGENAFRLINVNRAEPAAYLFQAPAAYQMLENK